MKNLKIVLATLALAVAVVGFSSFKSNSFNKKAFSVRCFLYDASVGTKTQPEAYSEDVITICNNFGKFCAICFNDTDFPLVDGLPSQSLLNQIFPHTLSLTANPETIFIGGKAVQIWQKP